MSPSTNLLSIRNLACTLGGRRVIQSLDLDVQMGEFIGLIGPNGSGKTTLLKLIDGLLTPDGGDILLDGKSIKELKTRDIAKMVAFMSQDPGPGFSLSVLDVLLFGRYSYLGLFQRETSSDLEKARRMLSYVGLAGFEERMFNELSGGERQLVLFAQILVQESAILLLDEPTSNLDIKHQERIFSMALELAGENRVVIGAIHNLNEAARYCSRLVLLDRGKIAVQGAPEEVLRPEVLESVYGVKTKSGVNPMTGSYQVSVISQSSRAVDAKIHLIGGAGSAINLTRELKRLGFKLSGGIAHRFDSDEKLWKSLEVESYVVDAFSSITDEDVLNAEKMAAKADITILCSFPVGPGNLGNLKLAERAKNLVLLKEESQAFKRSFFSQEAETLLCELIKKGRVMSYSRLIDWLMDNFAGDRT